MHITSTFPAQSQVSVAIILSRLQESLRSVPLMARASTRRKEAVALSLAMHVGADDDVLAVWTSIIVLVHRYTQEHY